MNKLKIILFLIVCLNLCASENRQYIQNASYITQNPNAEHPQDAFFLDVYTYDGQLLETIECYKNFINKIRIDLLDPNAPKPKPIRHIIENSMIVLYGGVDRESVIATCEIENFQALTDFENIKERDFQEYENDSAQYGNTDKDDLLDSYEVSSRLDNLKNEYYSNFDISELVITEIKFFGLVSCDFNDKEVKPKVKDMFDISQCQYCPQMYQNLGLSHIGTCRKYPNDFYPKRKRTFQCTIL